MNGNMMLAWPNRIDTAVLDGGGWATSMPLSKMQNRVLAIRARSIDDDPANTWFRTTLAIDYAVRVIGLAHHNLSVLARCRIRGATDSGFTQLRYDSDWFYVYEGQGEWGPPDTWLEWEDDRFWSGGPVAEQIDGYRQTLIHVLPERTNARYWRIDIDDVGNQAGYIEIGRAFFADAWQPMNNLSYGCEIAWNSRTNVEEAAGGAEYFDVRQPYRTFRGALDWLEPDEALMGAQELQRRMDVWGEVMFILKPSDATYRRQQSFLARLRQLGPLEYPYFNARRTAVELKEIL
jgi:hypothetical protein